MYAVAFAANNNGTFPGSVSLAAGLGFTAESQVGNPMVEDKAAPGTVSAQATITVDANPRGFLFALGIGAASF